LEEAGVHGRIEEIPFARYFRSGPDATVSEPAVAAYLCEVTRREAPQETNRNPTWFSAEKAKLRLRQDRGQEFGSELARVVDRASSRIQRLRSDPPSSAKLAEKDELQKVKFDFLEARLFDEGPKQAAFIRHLLRQPEAKLPAINAAAGIERRILRLGAGVDTYSEPARNVTAIDSAPAAGLSKPRNVPSARNKSSRRVSIQ
jgi:hypothetical protein